MPLSSIQCLRRILFAVFLGAALCPGTALHADAQKIRIAYSSRSNSAAPFQMTLTKGFFKEEGLEVELIQVNPRLGAHGLGLSS